MAVDFWASSIDPPIRNLYSKIAGRVIYTILLCQHACFAQGVEIVVSGAHRRVGALFSQYANKSRGEFCVIAFGSVAIVRYHIYHTYCFVVLQPPITLSVVGIVAVYCNNQQPFPVYISNHHIPAFHFPQCLAAKDHLLTSPIYRLLKWFPTTLSYVFSSHVSLASMKSWWQPLEENSGDDNGHVGFEANGKPAQAAPSAVWQERLDTSNVQPQQSGPTLPMGTKSGRDYAGRHLGNDLRDVEPPPSLLVQPQIRTLVFIEGIYSVCFFFLTGAAVGGGRCAIVFYPCLGSQSCG